MFKNINIFGEVVLKLLCNTIFLEFMILLSLFGGEKSVIVHKTSSSV